MSCAAPIPTPGSILQQRAGLIRLVEPAADDHRIRRRLEGLGDPTGRLERGVLGQPLTNGRELEQGERSSIHDR